MNDGEISNMTKKDNDADFDSILSEEYSERFDEIRKNMIVTSYYKFGPVKKNYTGNYLQAIPSLKNKLADYEATGNTEFLADVANFAMIEFMYPQHPNGHYEGTDGSLVGTKSTVGMSVREIENYKDGGTKWWAKYGI